MYIADLHIHSKYSIATSKEGDAPHLDLWARKKGIGLLGTGDFTHPVWRASLKEQLEPAEEGLYRLRRDACIEGASIGEQGAPRFVITGEISSIYKKNGKVRKVHNLLLLPSLEAAEQLAHKLEAIGNIHSDGRPILGIDSRDLLEITLETCQDAIFIPAHIWTPHFSLFGAFSGFDTIEECFEDLTPYIHALETGLSSDPPMNWRVSALDRFQLVSNSDAHSPAKLGREANLLETERSYPHLKKAIETGEGLFGTIEFFPEEGKYHLDGHRNCQICLTPEETAAFGGKCPACGKKITIGVQNRVEQLADREEGFIPETAKHFESLAPLPEVIASSLSFSSGSAKVAQVYETLLHKLGSEFYILREAPLEDVKTVGGPCLMEGLRRLRQGEVERTPGYDGEYGKITLLSPEEVHRFTGQLSLLGEEEKKPNKQKKGKKKEKQEPAAEQNNQAESKADAHSGALNPKQLEAATATEPVVAVIAGPGTGKTKTLIARILHLLQVGKVSPSQITAVTFTNQAADEIRLRLEQQLGGKQALRGITVGTFHSICLQLLDGVNLLGETEALEIARRVIDAGEPRISPRKLLQAVSKMKNGLVQEQSQAMQQACRAYCDALELEGVLDFDDLLLKALEKGQQSRQQFTHLLIDEFQDTNDIQYRLMMQWSTGGKSLFVIGDPDQGIYGFRGGDSRCFERLKREYPGLLELRLVENYRSTPQILCSALPAISQNPGEERVLLPQCLQGEPVRLVSAVNDFSEAVFIAKEISRMAGGMDMLQAKGDREVEKLRSFSEIAVLCRTHRQGALIEKCLRHDDIPCIVTGREDFLMEDAARGCVAFFHALQDIREIRSLRLSLALCWHFSVSDIDQVEHLCREIAEWDIQKLKEKCIPGMPLAERWLGAVGTYLPLIQKEKPYQIITRWIGEHEPCAALEQLRNIAVFYSDMPAFLNAVLYGEEGDLFRISGKQYASGAVKIMTLHSAKGLEFPVVFLAGVSKGVLPLESSNYSSDVQEERRLLYVGMTRAREELILSYAQEPSQFLLDIPAQTLQKQKAAEGKPLPLGKQLTLF